jgi:hypothetical protein
MQGVVISLVLPEGCDNLFPLPECGSLEAGGEGG